MSEEGDREKRPIRFARSNTVEIWYEKEERHFLKWIKKRRKMKRKYVSYLPIYKIEDL